MQLAEFKAFCDFLRHDLLVTIHIQAHVIRLGNHPHEQGIQGCFRTIELVGKLRRSTDAERQRRRSSPFPPANRNYTGGSKACL